MASNKPAQCCTIGVRHEGEPTGELINIGKTSTYIARPEDGKTDYGILIFTDVIGHKFNNAQLIADQFAANGYFVVMPDLFHGDPIPLNRPEGFDLQEWLKGHQTQHVDPIGTEAIKFMREKHGCKKIGTVGYCFGAKYSTRFLGAKGKELTGTPLDVSYVAHPSFVDPEELRAITGPYAIAAAETDSIFPAEKRHQTEEILKELAQGEKKIPYQMNLYSGVEHGFAVRGDLNDKHLKYAKEAAFTQAVMWFDTFLKGKN